MTRDDRLVSLDALRAVAAAMVVIHHGGPPLLGFMLLPKAYLAVDFFFMLSGFVMSLAYDDQLKSGLGSSAMFCARVKRLYPTLAVGLALGATTHVWGGMDLFSAQVLLLTGLLFVPVLSGPENGIFVIDGVQWSLLFELVANYTHAKIYRLSNKQLTVLAGVAALALLAAAWIFGSLAIGDRGGNVIGGFARVAFPYLVGMLLYRAYRAGALAAASVGTMACPATLCVVLLMPDSALWWTDPLVVIVVFPLLLAVTITSSASGRFRSLEKFGGRLSYPLYAVHLSALAMAGAFFDAFGLPRGWSALAGGFVYALLLAAATEALMRRVATRNTARNARRRNGDQEISYGRYVDTAAPLYGANGR